MTCPRCGGQTRWIPPYSRYWCDRCQYYPEPPVARLAQPGAHGGGGRTGLWLALAAGGAVAIVTVVLVLVSRGSGKRSVEDDFEVIVDDICACKSMSCVERATKKMEELGRKHSDGDSKPSERLMRLADRLSDCMRRVVEIDHAPDKPSLAGATPRDDDSATFCRHMASIHLSIGAADDHARMCPAFFTRQFGACSNRSAVMDCLLKSGRDMPSSPSKQQENAAMEEILACRERCER